MLHVDEGGESRQSKTHQVMPMLNVNTCIPCTFKFFEGEPMLA